MNEILIRGYLRDIAFSHYQGSIEYEKANLVCPRTGGKEEDVISLRYKKFTNKYKYYSKIHIFFDCGCNNFFIYQNIS